MSKTIVATSLAAILIIEIGVAATILTNEQAAQRSDNSRKSVFQRPNVSWRKVNTPPIVLPSTQSAREVALPDDEKVIGIAVNGVARAYQFTAFEGKSAHLVNDVIGGAAVSIAYCDISGCLRLFTAADASAPLDIQVAGLLDGEMVLKRGSQMYYQKSGEPVDVGETACALPWQSETPVVTTWRDWRTGHPDTRVYVGPGRLKGVTR